jgi:hypothetical protein
MLKRNWRPIALPALGAVALIVVGWGILGHPTCIDTLKSLQNEEPKPEEAAYEGSVTCERDCQVTFGLSPNTKNKPSNRESEQNDTCDTTAELDLVQQMVMAHWAIVSALLAMLGLFGVLFTFRETHKMGQLQTRAYISVNGGHVRFNVSDYIYFEFAINVHNTGQSPAFEINIDGNATVQSGSPDRGKVLSMNKFPSLTIYEVGGGETVGKTARILGDILSAVAEMNKGAAYFSFFGTMRYNDIYGVSNEKRFAVGAEGGKTEPDSEGWVKYPLIQIHPDQFEDKFNQEAQDNNKE